MFAKKMKTLALISILAIQTALCGTPSEALENFKKAAQSKDFEATWKHAAKFDSLPEQVTEHLKSKVRKLIVLASKGWDFKVMDEKIDGDCAVVAIKEPKKNGNTEVDIDPAYMLLQDGEWRVFPDVTGWRIAEDAAKDKVETYKKLEAWYKERKIELKKKGNG